MTKTFRYTLFILTILSNFTLNAQNRWDQEIILEADVWRHLILNYGYGDKSYYWTERKEALVKYPAPRALGFISLKYQTT